MATEAGGGIAPPVFKKVAPSETENNKSIVSSLNDIKNALTTRNTRVKDSAAVTASSLSSMIKDELSKQKQTGETGPLLSKVGQIEGHKNAQAFQPIDYLDFLLGNKSLDQIATERTQKGVELGISAANDNLRTLANAVALASAPLATLSENIKEQRKVFGNVSDRLDTLVPIEEEELAVLKESRTLAQQNIKIQTDLKDQLISILAPTHEEAGLTRIGQGHFEVGKPTTFIDKVLGFFGKAVDKTVDLFTGTHDSLRKFSEALDTSTHDINKHGLDSRDLPGILGTVASIIFIFKNIGALIAGFEISAFVDAVGGFIAGMSELIPVFLIFDALITSWIAFPDKFKALTTQFGKTIGSIGTTFGLLADIAGKIFVAIQPVLVLFGGVLTDGMTMMLYQIQQIFDSANVALKAMDDFLGSQLSQAKDNWSKLPGKNFGEKIGPAFNELLNGFVVVWTEDIAPIFQQMLDPKNPNSLTSAMINFFTGLGPAIAGVFNGVINWVINGDPVTNSINDAVNGFFAGIGPAIGGIFSGIVNWIVNGDATTNSLGAAITDSIKGLFAAISDIVSQTTNSVVQFFVTLPGKIIDSLSQDPFVLAVKGLIDAIIGLIPTPGQIATWFDQMVQGSFLPQQMKDALHAAYLDGRGMSDIGKGPQIGGDILQNSLIGQLPRPMYPQITDQNIRNAVLAAQGVTSGGPAPVIIAPRREMPSPGGGSGGIMQGFHPDPSPFHSPFDIQLHGPSSMLPR